MKALVSITLAVVVAGCAAQSKTIPIGDGSFFISKQAATGFTGLGSLKAEALSEANAKCAASKKTMHVLNTSESQPPFILGNYPRVEVQFACR